MRRPRWASPVWISPHFWSRNMARKSVSVAEPVPGGFSLVSLRPAVTVQSVSSLSVGAYTTTLHVMVDIVKGDWRAPPTRTSLGKFFHHDGIYARKYRVTIATLCTLWFEPRLVVIRRVVVRLSEFDSRLGIPAVVSDNQWRSF